jgi:hypothetical protein
MTSPSRVTCLKPVGAINYVIFGMGTNEDCSQLKVRGLTSLTLPYHNTSSLPYTHLPCAWNWTLIAFLVQRKEEKAASITTPFTLDYFNDSSTAKYLGFLRRVSSPSQFLHCTVKCRFYILSVNSWSLLHLACTYSSFCLCFMWTFQRRHFNGIQHSNVKLCDHGNYYGGDEKFQDRHLSGRPLFCASLGLCTLYITYPFPDSFAALLWLYNAKFRFYVSS